MLKSAQNFFFLVLFLTSASASYAYEAAELSRASIQSANYFLWASVFIGVLVGFVVHRFMHKRYMAFDKFLPIIPAILVGLALVYMPHLLSSQGDFSQACFQAITDGNGQVRETIHLADDCAVSREEVSAWGIGSVISGYKDAFGYADTDRFLSTAAVYFFYYFVVAFWIVALYSAVLWGYRKFKN